MAVTATPALPQNPKHYSVQLSSGASTSPVTLVTGGTNGTKITSVIASNSDTVANNVIVGITTSAVFYRLGTLSIPASAGWTSTAVSLNVIDPAVIKGLPIDNDGQNYLFLNSSAETLQVQASTAGTAGTVIQFNAFGADF